MYKERHTDCKEHYIYGEWTSGMRERERRERERERERERKGGGGRERINVNFRKFAGQRRSGGHEQRPLCGTRENELMNEGKKASVATESKQSDIPKPKQ